MGSQKGRRNRVLSDGRRHGHEVFRASTTSLKEGYRRIFQVWEEGDEAKLLTYDSACLQSVRSWELWFFLQALYSLFDLELHGSNAEGVIAGRYTTTDLFRSMWTTVLPGVALAPETAYQHRFQHYCIVFAICLFFCVVVWSAFFFSIEPSIFVLYFVCRWKLFIFCSSIFWSFLLFL